ncbi:Putative ribonuclease H protein At1g65750 [Linum perenne]
MVGAAEYPSFTSFSSSLQHGAKRFQDPGPSDWMIVNTDEAVNLSTRRAVAGGLIWDELGHCVAAFTMNIGCCSITRAELRGAITSLRAAWDLGFRKVKLQVDSMTVIELVKNEEIPTHQHALEVLDLRDLLRLDWEVNLRHVFKEGNCRLFGRY